MATNEYYTLGRSGLRVSRLALGTMTFGTEWGWGADKANANLSLPTMGMVFGMVLFLAYPVMTQIADAFT